MFCLRFGFVLLREPIPFLLFREPFSFVAHFKFWLREPALQDFIIYGPGPFSLREPALEEECY